MTTASNDRQGLLDALLDDGRPLLSLTALCLIFSGLFCLFLSVTKHFLPHDVAFLGMSPADLCAIHECRIVHFMLHDRVSFGGSIIAIGMLYLWLVHFPLRAREPWAWWLFVLSGGMGFGSFLLYLGYGYLDTWHGVATLCLFPCFVLGLVKSWYTLGPAASALPLTVPGDDVAWASVAGIGRLLLLATAAALAVGGFAIMSIGATTVFVPQDLAYMGLSVEELQAINPRLVPLIAHDRAGFGGGVCCCGVTMFFCLWCGRPGPALWQALLATGLVGFGTAIGVHPAIGYEDFVHLAPAVLGAAMFTIGIALSYGHMNGGDRGI